MRNRDGDNFVFDIGSGSAANLASLAIPYDELDRLFLTHLHQDHVGDLIALWIGGWTGGRHGALHVWGPSGEKPELGTKHLVESMKSTYGWDYNSRLGIIPSRGGDLDVLNSSGALVDRTGRAVLVSGRRAYRSAAVGRGGAMGATLGY